MLLLHLLVEVMENLSHKNDLNSYCQRLNTPLPVYNTTFACTVSVGGKTFTSSSSTFTNRRSAEQDAAKLALQYLLNEDTSPTTNLRKLVCQDKTRCKMILNEFIDKIEMECVYETVQVEMGHVFVSSLVLNGTCYKGECGKNKKEAEPLAALAAILSLLGEQGGSGILVRKKKKDLVNSLPQIENQVNKTSLPQTEKQGGHGVLFGDTQCVTGHLPGVVTISRCSYVPLCQ
ncbi:unnamed protein product [Brassica rapa subsp. trilocularis]